MKSTKEITQKDYLERINKVIVYIEENTHEKLVLEDLAAIANFSSFHFHRIFKAYIGESLNSYIKRIRLQKSTLKLKHTKQNITDIALDSGYETISSYTKAFKKFFGISPTEFKADKYITSYSKLREASDRKSLNEMIMNSFRGIKTISDMQVLFVKRTGEYNKITRQAWMTLFKYVARHKLEKQDTIRIGMPFDNPYITEEEKLRYDACITYSGDFTPEGEIGIKTIKGGKHAMFLHKGHPKGLYDFYDAIFLEWLAESGETPRDFQPFEIFVTDQRKTKLKDFEIEVYLPIE